jgi:hypothetical protein
MSPFDPQRTTWIFNKFDTLANENASMRISVACLAILAFSHPAVAIDVQPGDRAVAVHDAIGCSEWRSFEAFRDTDPRTVKSGLPLGCLIVHGAPPTSLVIDAVRQDSGAICVHVNGLSERCFWFPLDKVVVGLSAGQQRI